MDSDAFALQVRQSTEDEVLVSDDGEIKFAVQVFNPGVMKVHFRVGFVCGIGFDLVSVLTKDSHTSLPKSAFSTDHPIVPSRLDAERIFFRVGKEFALQWKQQEWFGLAFRRDRPFEPGEVLRFTVRVVSEDGSKVQDVPLSFTFN